MTPKDFLARLVAFPTVVGRSNEALMDFAQDHLARSGARVTRLPGPDAGRANLFASIGPADRPGYILSAHVDVVPADEPGWRADPFTLREDGARLIGRGAVDMKGFVAAVLAAVPDLVAMRLQTPIHICLSYDEEAGCRGAPHMIARLPELCPPPLGCFVGEPTGMTPVLRHKGKATLRLEARGKPGHSARPDLGTNAIHALLPSLTEAARLPDTLAERGQNLAFVPPVSTAQIGTVQGGRAVNIIPDAATALVEVRAIPGHDPEALLTPVIDLARATGLSAEIIAAYPALELDEADPLCHLACDLTGTAAQPAVSFGTEAGLFQRAGIPAVICGPGDMSRAHKPEEYITTEELDAAHRFVLALARRVGGPEHP